MFLGRKMESAKLDRNKDVTLCNDEITFTMSMRDDIPWPCALMKLVKWQTWYKVRSKLFDSVRHALRGRWKTLVIFDKLKSSLQWTYSLPQRGLQAFLHTFSTKNVPPETLAGFQITIFLCSAALKWNCFNFCFQVFPSLCALDCHVRYLHRDRFLASVTMGRWACPESSRRPVEVVKVCLR